MTRQEKEALLKRIYALPTEWADAGGSYGKGGPVGSDDAAMLWPEDVIDAINQFAEDNNVPCKPSDRCGCGGKAILIDYTVEGALKQYSVACETCFIGLPYGFDTPDDAWAAWRRAMGTPSGAIGPEADGIDPNGDEGEKS